MIVWHPFEQIPKRQSVVKLADIVDRRFPRKIALCGDRRLQEATRIAFRKATDEIKNSYALVNYWEACLSAPTVTSDQAEKYRDRIAEARRALPPADAGLELWAFDGADEFFCSLLPNFRAMAPSFASRTPMRTDTDQWV